MCGILYSLDSNGFTNLEMLKRRGPEGFEEVKNELGYFAHSMLNTIGQNTPQPYHTKSGIMLYNGSTYNSGEENDTKWIGDKLDDNLQNTLDVIRQLNGEYALIYVTQKNVVFCVDHFDSRNLWFYHDKDTEQLTISSLPNVVRQKHKMTWRVHGNQIYVVDRQDYSVSIENNKTWNLDQNVNHFDFVFEKFETAIQNRYDPNFATNFLSSGFDSGVINCATRKLFGTVDSVCDPDKEVKETLRRRVALHRAVVLPNYGQHHNDKYLMFEKIIPVRDVWDDPCVDGLINLMKKYVVKRKKKIILTGNGGDEIYNDWQLQKKGHVWSKTNGAFPSSLNLVWPWHNDHERMMITNTRVDMIAGYYGLECRNPLLDVDLVQSWLNTKSALKNSYKAWMKQYMQDHHYPYTMTKVHSWASEYQPDDWMISKSPEGEDFVS